MKNLIMTIEIVASSGDSEREFKMSPLHTMDTNTSTDLLGFNLYLSRAKFCSNVHYF